MVRIGSLRVDRLLFRGRSLGHPFDLRQSELKPRDRVPATIGDDADAETPYGTDVPRQTTDAVSGASHVSAFDSHRMCSCKDPASWQSDRH